MNTCIKILNIGINKNYIFMNFEIKNTNIDPYNYFSQLIQFMNIIMYKNMPYVHA